MKKLLTLLLSITIFSSCSSDENEDDKTKTTVTIENKSGESFNFLLAYKDGNIYKRIGNLQIIRQNEVSQKIVIDNISISEIYVFNDYGKIITAKDSLWRKFDTVYQVVPLIENKFLINPSTKMKLVDITDNTQFPK